MEQMTALRIAFVMEQTLGHVTHAKNLRAVLAQQDAVVPSWLPIPFDVNGAGRALPLWRSNWSVRASWRARRALDSALSTAPHDAAFFHTQVTSLFAAPLIRRMPSVISLDATPINYDSVGAFYSHKPAGLGLLDRQKYRLNRDVFHAAVALVSWSNWARRSLVEDYGVPESRVHVLAPGAAPEYFEIGRRRLAGALPDRPLRAGEAVQLLFVGGDFRRKGGPLLLEALAGDLGRRCELHIVTKDDVPAQAGVVVHREVGPNSPELLRLFAAADIFVLPSMAECLAVVLMEATAAGLPVVTTDVGALSEAVLPGESGYLVQSGDGVALRRSLAALVDDVELRQRQGRAGLALASAKYDSVRNNRALLSLLTEVARARYECDARRRAA